MHKLRRRLASVALVVVVAGCALAVGVTVSAPAAFALGSGGCPAGALLGMKNGFGEIACIDSETGEYVGYISGTSQKFFADPLPRTATQLDLPSSVIGDTTTTVEAGAGAAEVDAEAGSGLELLLGSSAETGAGGILAAGAGGYMLGHEAVNFVCDNYSWAPSMLCGAKVENYTPNGDLASNPNGWAPYSQPWGPYTPSGGPTVSGVHPVWNPGFLQKATYLAPLSQLRTIVAGDTAEAWTTTGGSVDGVPMITVQAVCAPNADGSGTPFVCGSINTLWFAGTGSHTIMHFSTPGGYTVDSQCGSGTCFSTTLNSGYLLHFNVTHLDICCTSAGGLMSPAPVVPADAWYPQGSPDRPAFDTDPKRDLFERKVCLAPDGTTTNVDGPQSETFTEATVGQILPNVPAVDLGCPAGTTLWKTQIIEHTLNGTIPDHILQTITVPDAYRNFLQQYPGCESGVCRLGLYQVNPDGTEKLDCWTDQGAPNDACGGWFSDPNKQQEYVCTYGKTNTFADAHVDLSECNAYAPSFDPQKQEQGVPYGDPKTGKVPDGSPAPSPEPGPEPGPAPLPGGDGSACWPHGWAEIFNPASWVLMPIKCALVWAFVPSEGVMQGWGEYVDEIEMRPPINIVVGGFGFITGVFTAYQDCAAPVAGGTNPYCDSLPPDEFGFVSGAAQDAAGSQAWALVYKLIELGVWMGGFLAIWRMSARGFGSR